MAPSLSVIIPTKNRPAALAAALKSIDAQTVRPDEVVVIDQSAGAPYASISGLTVARNVAIEKAKGDILLFIDDDVTLYPDFVANLLLAYKENPSVAGISGIPDNYSPPNGFYLGWSKMFMRGPFHDDRQPVYWGAKNQVGPVRVSRMTGAMMSFRHSCINRTRFDANLCGVSDGEDVDFCVRLKGSYLIDPRCKLTHHFNSTGRESDWLRRHARAYTYLYLRNWSDHKSTYIWLCIGWAFAAVLSCVRRKSIGPLRSVLTGYREGRKVGNAPSNAPDHWIIAVRDVRIT